MREIARYFEKRKDGEREETVWKREKEKTVDIPTGIYLRDIPDLTIFSDSNFSILFPRNDIR